MPPAQPYTQADFPRTVPLPMPWWYRADQVTLVGSKASVITDLSGNGINSVQAVDANRFVWSATSGPNSTPGLTSTGTQFSATGANVDLSAATQLTVIAVVKPNAIAAAQVIVTNKLASGTNEGFNLLALSGSPDVYRNLACSPPISAPFSETSSANPAAANSPTIIESTYDQTVATNQTFIWINGVLNAQTRVINNQSTGGFQSLVLTMGDGTSGFPGVWSECFAYVGLLTAQERQNLYRGYLSPRYGIVVP